MYIHYTYIHCPVHIHHPCHWLVWFWNYIYNTLFILFEEPFQYSRPFLLGPCTPEVSGCSRNLPLKTQSFSSFFLIRNLLRQPTLVSNVSELSHYILTLITLLHWRQTHTSYLPLLLPFRLLSLSLSTPPVKNKERNVGAKRVHKNPVESKENFHPLFYEKTIHFFFRSIIYFVPLGPVSLVPDFSSLWLHYDYESDMWLVHNLTSCVE